MKHIVMFDIDGVLADFYTAYRTVQESLGQEPTFSVRWDDYWNPAVWEYIKNSPDYYRRVPPLVSKFTFERIADLTYVHDVYFVTARGGPSAKAQTTTWLQQRGIANASVVLSPRKAEMARAIRATVAIDDKAGNAIAVSYISPETASFLLDSPFNQFNHDVVGGKVRRVKSVDDFLDEVSR